MLLVSHSLQELLFLTTHRFRALLYIMHHSASCVLLSGASQSCIPTCCCESVWGRRRPAVSSAQRLACVNPQRLDYNFWAEPPIVSVWGFYLPACACDWIGQGRGEQRKCVVDGLRVIQAEQHTRRGGPKETNDGSMFIWRPQCGCLRWFRFSAFRGAVPLCHKKTQVH